MKDALPTELGTVLQVRAKDLQIGLPKSSNFDSVLYCSLARSWLDL